MFRIRTLLAVLCLVALLLASMGCYKTETPLGSPDTAAVDTSYVGDYSMTVDHRADTIAIRNIDNHLYYVEWTEDNKTNRIAGYTATVNGTLFANLRDLTDDGSIDKKYLIMRISLSDDHNRLTLRNLKDDFFKDKNINSSEALQTVIAQNVDNEQMYDGDAVVATRVAPTTQPGQ
jgi:hypothetical protein